MSRKTKLILLFYRSWAPASLLVTIVCAVTLARIGVVVLPGVLLLKVVVAALVGYFVRGYGARRICYFTNLGVSPRELWGWSMALDFLIFAICMAAATTYNLL